MKRALALAQQGQGRVHPNPMVGAVVVQNGEIVGEGYHLYSQRDHAEVKALRAAGEKARNATLYVSLEPCCHEGRTPPCTRAIISSGIRRVVVAVKDANPAVGGKGVVELRESGIDVEEGLCSEEAFRLNEAFFHFVETGRPLIRLKLALTLDGKIADDTGHSKWITSKRSRREGQRLRFRSDAILVGINTILQDDPDLTVRWPSQRTISKIVLDSALRTPIEARIFESGDPVWLFCKKGASAARAKRLEKRARIFLVDQIASGELDWEQILSSLKNQSIGSLLIEGGGRVASSALRSGIVHKLCLFVAPRLLGQGIPGILDLGVPSLDQSIQIKPTRLRKLGDDFLFEGDIV